MPRQRLLVVSMRYATDFVVGRYGRFDALAAKCVKVAKKRHPEVTLTLLLPYHPYDRPSKILFLYYTDITVKNQPIVTRIVPLIAAFVDYGKFCRRQIWPL